MFRQILILTALIMLSACNKPNETITPPVTPPITPPVTPPTDYTRPVTGQSSKWISTIIDFRPAPGQFVNTSTANADTPNKIIGKRGMVSLGGYGGSITFMFDHTVLNQDGVDFVIQGNAFEGGSEPGVVMVSFDSNGNGKADDEWYEIKGSESATAKRNYSITYTRPTKTDQAADVAWTASDGTSGVMSVELVSGFHPQCFYPLFLEGNPATLNLSGTLLPFNGVQSANGQWKLTSFDGGYVDNFSADYTTVVGTDIDTKNSNKFDLANAIDKDGKAVELKGIDFVKVICAVNGQAGWLGEVSTEVCGAISLSVR